MGEVRQIQPRGMNNRTKTANVLLWITKLDTTDGQSRTSVSDVTLEATGCEI